MKKKTIIKGIITLSALSLIGGGVIAANSANAASATSDSTIASNSVAAGRHFGRGRGMADKKIELTDAQKTEMKTKMAEQQTKMDAVKAALESGNYETWAAAVKTLNEKSPVLEKINAGNFSRYTEAEKLRQQADSIMAELGINGREFGMGDFGHGRPNGPKPETTENSAETIN
jgi:hypothetical protein